LSESREPTLLLAVILAAWVIASGWSVVGAWLAEPTGDGFTRGANRIGHFLGWQAVAGLLGLAAFGVGRSWPKGSGPRRLSAGPLWLALLLVAALVAFYAWAMLFA